MRVVSLYRSDPAPVGLAYVGRDFVCRVGRRPIEPGQLLEVEREGAWQLGEFWWDGRLDHRFEVRVLDLDGWPEVFELHGGELVRLVWK